MEYLKLFIFCALILGEALFLIQKLKFPQQLSILSVILSNTLILYFFSLFDWLRAGFYICLVLAVFAWIGAFFKPKFSIKDKTLLFIAFLIIFVLSFLYTRGTLFYGWDEFSHWGIIYKYLMQMQKLPEDLNTVIVSYPPFTALWQYFVSSIIGFKEENAYFAHLLLEFSALTAVFPAKKNSSWKEYCLFGVAALFSVFIFDFRFQSLYVDLCLGLLFAAGLSQAKLEGHYSSADLFSVFLISCSLVLVKPIGIGFALLVVLINGISIVYLKIRETHAQFTFKQGIKAVFQTQLILLVIIPVLVWFSWSQYTKSFTYSTVKLELTGTQYTSADIYPWIPDDYLADLQKDHMQYLKNLMKDQSVVNTISIADIFRSFTINAPYRTKVISNHFIDAFSTNSFSAKGMSLKVAGLGILAIIIINSILLKHKRKVFLYLNGAILLGCFVYMIALYLSYITVFQSAGLSVPSIHRYMGSYLLGWWLFNLGTLYSISVESDLKHPYGTWAAGLFVLVGFLVLPISSYLHLPESPAPERFIVYNQYKTISQVKFTQEDKVYEVYSDLPEDYGYRHFYMRYYLAPIASNYQGWTIDVAPDGSVDYTIQYSPAEWMDVLTSQQYTYVLVTQANNQFWTEYGSLFDHYASDSTEPQIFKVTKTSLQLIDLKNEAQ